MDRKNSLDLRDRRGAFAALEAQTFDILIIGAGITGCGVARDASMRGLSVALVEATDIGAGTSSRSSKLIHGGLRYLAQGDVFVVKEAAVERRVVRATAPHLAQTMPLVIPIRSKKGMAQMRAAMWSYEKLGNVSPEERHEVWDVARLKAEEPCVVADGLLGAVVYPEYVTDDLRLTVANARSAAGHGTRIVTYACVEEMIHENGKTVGAVIRGTLPGDEQREARVQARVVVNAAGPWVDAVRRLEDSKAKSKLELTKGIHLVVENKRLPIRRTIIMETPDRRSIFAVPREAFVYIGTTDTFYADPEYWPEITQEDIDYLLGPVNKTHDITPINGKDIIAAWAGLRPLLATKGKDPSEISRRHEVMEGSGGVLSVAGGKLTSYRSMAERVVDRCEKGLGRKPTPSSTAEEALPGGDFSESIEDLCSRLRSKGLGATEAERAVRLYGTEAFDLHARGENLDAEVGQAVESEGALTLEDYWVRRSARARFELDGGEAALGRASERMAELLGWTEEERARQVEHCRNTRDEEMKVSLKTS
jgi:glycerol-3-phosphate dehydrogenase